MTVLKHSRQKHTVYGVKEYLRSPDPTAPTTIIQFGPDIYEDVQPFIDPAAGYNFGYANIFPHVSIDMAGGNASKFKSPLPKLDYGSYAYSNQGSVTHDGFLNYQTQLLQPGCFYPLATAKIFPDSPDLIPDPANYYNGVFGSTNALPNIWNTFADTIYLQMNADIVADMFIYIFYFQILTLDDGSGGWTPL